MTGFKTFSNVVLCKFFSSDGVVRYGKHGRGSFLQADIFQICKEV